MSVRRIRARHARRIFGGITALAAIYTMLAYILIPLASGYFSEPIFQPSDGVPRLTETRDHHAGDPINVALVGDEAAVKSAMAAAGWFPPDPLGFRSDLDIAADIILDRAYVTAPVSRLFLFGRSEDLAFEKPSGRDPDTRHHVRLWHQAADAGPQQPAVYLGATSFDRGIGLSHETGQLTHHIAPDVDLERDLLKTDLMQTGQLSDSEIVTGFHDVRSGRNGGGDPWTTDGDLWVGVLREEP